MKHSSYLLFLVLFSYASYADIEADKKGCHKGNADSCNYVADAYEAGDGVPINHNTALDYYSKACELNSGYGCRWLGILQDPFFTEYEVDKSDEEATQSYLKGCRLNDSAACNNVARSYKEGHGVEVDLDLAIRYFTKGCDELEDGYACSNLAYMYDNGEGLVTNRATAAKYYRKGCDEFEDSLSCYNLGVFILNDEGGTIDDKDYKRYFALACEYGDQDACDFLKR